jgi:hypothetical protein
MAHGFVGLKPAVLQADYGPANGFLYPATGGDRNVLAGDPRCFLGRVKPEAHTGRQGRSLLEPFGGLLLDLMQQGGQTQSRRFFFSA